MSIGKKVIPCGVCHMGLHAVMATSRQNLENKPIILN